MKGDKAAALVFAPDEEGNEDTLDLDDEKDSETAKGGLEDLLGNAFDAYHDDDREGFIRSMKAAIKSGE